MLNGDGSRRSSGFSPERTGKPAGWMRSGFCQQNSQVLMKLFPVPDGIPSVSLLFFIGTVLMPALFSVMPGIVNEIRVTVRCQAVLHPADTLAPEHSAFRSNPCHHNDTIIFSEHLPASGRFFLENKNRGVCGRKSSGRRMLQSPFSGINPLYK